MEIFYFGKEKTEKRLVVWYKKECEKGCYKKKDNLLFSTSTISETRNNWYNLQQRRFKLDIKNFFFPQLLRITIHWNRLHRNEAGALRNGFWAWSMQISGRDSLTIVVPIRLEKDGWDDQLKLLPELYVYDYITPFLQVRQWLGSILCTTQSLLIQIPIEIMGHFLVT